MFFLWFTNILKLHYPSIKVTGINRLNKSSCQLSLNSRTVMTYDPLWYLSALWMTEMTVSVQSWQLGRCLTSSSAFVFLIFPKSNLHNIYFGICFSVLSHMSCLHNVFTLTFVFQCSEKCRPITKLIFAFIFQCRAVTSTFVFISVERPGPPFLLQETT